MSKEEIYEPDRNSVDLQQILKELKDTKDNFDSFKTSCLEKIVVLEKEIVLLKSCTVNKRESKKKSFRAPKLLEELSTVNIPGLHYVAESRLHWLHKFLWGFVHLAALIVSYYYIYNAYNTWQSSPTVQSLTNTLTNVSDVPFPAVTYCVRFSLTIDYPEKVDHRKRCLSKIQNYSEYVNVSTTLCNEEENAIFLISSLFVPAQPENSALFNSTVNIDENTFFDIIRKIIATDSLIYDTNVGEYVDFLSNTFDTSPPFLLNDEFVCRTYNGLHYKSNLKDNVVYYIVNQSIVDKPSGCKWIPEDVLSPKCDKGRNELVYTNKSFHLKMHIKSNKRNKRTVWSDEEFLLSVHSPETIPTLGNLDYKAFSTSKDVIILIIPKLIVPEKDFHSLKPSTKGCLFSHERRLSMFRFYSQKNCLLECRLNCTMRKCGCVTFNQPRFNTTDICGKPKYRDCLTGVWCGHCNCLPDCVSLDYTIQLKEHGLKKNVNEHSDVHFRLKVVYKYTTFSTTLRHSINSMEEFIAYSAGILGVFNGFSLMALWEIMYLVVLRIWACIRRRIN